MNGSDGGSSGDAKTFRIPSLGGGIRGVFPAALLARLEGHLEHPIGRYFDLIAGKKVACFSEVPLHRLKELRPDQLQS
jgi:patatin-like phospholipase/acyl hydrolase